MYRCKRISPVVLLVSLQWVGGCLDMSRVPPEPSNAATGGEASATAGGSTSATNTGGSASALDGGCDVPAHFSWTSSDPLINPPNGSVSIKDPSVLFFNGKWHVYATEYDTSYNMVYLNFTDWAQADSAPKTLLSTNPNLAGYKCAPQLFYFAPQNLWYLVYQTQPPAYSTSTDPTDVMSWSAMTQFMPMPAIITGSNTGGIDYWVICDDTNCYLFFSADNGSLYRAQTSKADFPSGFGNTVIVMSQAQNSLFEASNVYKIKGMTKYLLLVEAIGNGRFFRSWTSDRLDGDANSWTPLADTPANAFASTTNVTGASWSTDGISHGEMLRDNPDETMTIDACKMQYLYQGRTKAGSSYNLNEYSLGLLTPTQ